MSAQESRACPTDGTLMTRDPDRVAADGQTLWRCEHGHLYVVDRASLADDPAFDRMVIHALRRLGQARPKELARALGGQCTVQAVTAALGRIPGARRHPNGSWSTPVSLRIREAVLARLPMVKWDRLVRDEEVLIAYGWIDRDDGRSDFVVVSFLWPDDPAACMSTTSSAEHSAAIGEILHGDGGHLECERIADVMPGLG